MNYSVSKNRDGAFWSLIFRDRRNRDGKFPSLFSIRDGIPSLFFNFLVVGVNFKKWPINQLSKQKMDIFPIDFLNNKWIFCSLCWKTLTPS